jgi:hypothetical protein
MQRYLARKEQQGVSLSGLLLWSVVVVMIVILGMRLLPSFMEHTAIKRALVSIANDPGLQQASSLREIRQSFDKRAAIDDIKTVSSRDLEIKREGGQTVLSVSYSVKTPLFANISLYIDFTAASN